MLYYSVIQQMPSTLLFTLYQLFMQNTEQDSLLAAGLSKGSLLS